MKSELLYYWEQDFLMLLENRRKEPALERDIPLALSECCRHELMEPDELLDWTILYQDGHAWWHRVDLEPRGKHLHVSYKPLNCRTVSEAFFYATIEQMPLNELLG